MEQVQCVSKSGVLPCWRCADLPRAMSGLAEESWRDRPYLSPCRIPVTENRHPVGKEKGEHIPQARGAVAFIFCLP